MRNVGKRSRVLTIVIALAVILIAAGLIMLATQVNKLETTKTVSSFMSYEVGKLNPSTGKDDWTKAQRTAGTYPDTDDYEAFMHLKEYINAEGLKCKLAEKAKITYNVYIFDEDYTLLASEVNIDEDYTFADNVVGAKYAMVEITPYGDPDGKISSSEIAKYAGMLTVTYNKFDE